MWMGYVLQRRPALSGNSNYAEEIAKWYVDKYIIALAYTYGDFITTAFSFEIFYYESYTLARSVSSDLICVGVRGGVRVVIRVVERLDVTGGSRHVCHSPIHCRTEYNFVNNESYPLGSYAAC